MDAGTYDKLTARERGVLLATATGRSAKQIGLELGLSHRTVEDALYTARSKVGVSRSIIAAQMLVAYEATQAGPVEVREAAAVAESVADPRFAGASGWPDELPRPQPSRVSDHVLREMPVRFEPVSITRTEPVERRRITDAVPRGIWITLVSAIGIPLVLAILSLLYLGLATIERVSLVPR